MECMKRVYLKVLGDENKILEKGAFEDTMWRIKLVANNPNPIVISPGCVESIPLGVSLKVGRDTEVKLLLTSEIVNGKGITALNSSFVCSNRNNYSPELIALLFNVGTAGNCTIKKGDVIGLLAFDGGDVTKIDLLIEGDNDKITFWGAYSNLD